MEVLSYLIPISIFLGCIGLAAFFWMLRNRQFDDPDGDANRILRSDYDDVPMD
jgi:cbb3-type cytochrome oxidase maturation protein